MPEPKNRNRKSRTCLFCHSTATYTRIVTETGYYDEIACRKHINELERDADLHMPGVMKLHISGSLKKRGDPFEWMLAPKGAGSE